MIKLCKWLSLIMLIAWMSLIFVNSSLNSTASDVQSKGLANTAFKVEEKDDNIDTVNLIIRKGAHITEYLILTILTFNFLYEFGIKKKLLFSFITTLLYAISDEFHQYFVPGRSCEIRDVLIDMIGFILFITIYFIYKKYKERRKQNV